MNNNTNSTLLPYSNLIEKNKVIRLCFSRIIHSATKVVLLFELGKNKACRIPSGMRFLTALRCVRNDGHLQKMEERSGGGAQWQRKTQFFAAAAFPTTHGAVIPSERSERGIPNKYPTNLKP